MKYDNDGYPCPLPRKIGDLNNDYRPPHVRVPLPPEPTRMDRLRLAELFRAMSQEEFRALSNDVWERSQGKVSLRNLTSLTRGPLSSPHGSPPAGPEVHPSGEPEEPTRPRAA